MSSGLPALVGAYGLGIFLVDFAWPWMGGDGFHALGLGCLLALFLARRSERVRQCASLALALAAGGASQGALLDASARFAPISPREINLEGVVCGRFSLGAGEGIEFCNAAEVPSPGQAPFPGSRHRFAPLPSRLLVAYSSSDPGAEKWDELRAGDRFRARVRMAPLGGLHNPGGGSSERRLRRRGIGGRARFVGSELGVQVRTRGGFLAGQGWSGALDAGVDRVRRRVATGLRGGGSDPDPSQSERGGLLAALAVGDRSGIEESTRAGLARLGMAHLLAISGLHLGLVAGLLFSLSRFLLAWTGDRGKDLRVVALAVAAAGSAAYALLAGFQPPVQRALVFVLGGLAAACLARPVSGLHLFCTAWLLVLFGSPYALFDLGTQLSFSATAALLAARSAWPQGEGRPAHLLLRWLSGLRSLLRVSALALAATAPWLAARGLVAGVPGLALNLVAIPWMSFALLPAAMASAVAAWAGGPVSEFVLRFGQCLAGVSLDALALLEAWVPGTGAVRPPAGGVALMISGGLAWVATRVLETRRVVGVCLASVAWLATAPSAVIHPSPPRVVMLDVGQGDAVLLQGRESAVLVDGARAIPGRMDLGRSVVAPALGRLGVDSLDAVLVSHGDMDHRGGIPALLDAVAVGELWVPWGRQLDPAFRASLQAAERNGVRVREVGAGAAAMRIGDMQVDFLWPRRGSSSVSANEGSLVVRVDLAGWRVLMTGDIGEAVETRLLESEVDLRAHVLKVPHHGSAGSSSPAFLEAVGPLWMLLSAPCGGGGHLPHPEALERLEVAGGKLGWTGRDGAVALGLPLDRGGMLRSRFFRPGQGRFCPEIGGSPGPPWRARHRKP